MTHRLHLRVEGVVLQGPGGVRRHDAGDVGEEELPEEVSGLAWDLSRHVVDAAHQHPGSFETGGWGGG